MHLQPDVVEARIEIVDPRTHDVGEVASVALVSKQGRLRLPLRLLQDLRVVQCETPRQVSPARILGLQLASEPRPQRGSSRPPRPA